MRFPFRLCVPVALFLIAGCGEDNTPELEQRAVFVFTKAEAALARNDHNESRRLLLEVTSLDARLGNSARRAEASLLLAENYSAGAHFDSAAGYYESARSVYATMNDRSGMRATALAMAKSLSLSNENDRASALLTEAIRFDEALGEHEGARDLRWALIPVARASGDYESEERLLKELSDYAATSGSGAFHARVEREIGVSSLIRHDAEAATTHFLFSASEALRGNDTTMAIEALLRSGVAMKFAGKEKEAMQKFTDALVLAERTRRNNLLREEILVRMGNMFIVRQQFSDAHRFLNNALRSTIKSQNKLLEGYALLQLAQCTKQLGRNAEALHILQAGAALLALTGIPWANTYANMCLGTVSLDENRLADALEFFRSAAAGVDTSFVLRDEFDVFADCEKTTLHGADAYDELIDLLFRIGKPDDAFRYAERRNRLTQLKTLGSMEIQTRDRNLNDAFASLLRERGRYAGAERQLASAFTNRVDVRPLALDIQQSFTRSSARLRELGDSLAFTNSNYRAATLLTEATLRDVQKTLPDEAALVEYVDVKRSLYAFVMTRASTSVHMTAIEKPALHSLMKEYISTLRQRNDEADKDKSPLDARIQFLSRRLYEIFLRPFDDALTVGTRLLIVLPPDFPYLPLHSLQKEGVHPAYAIELHSIRYMTDTDVLTLKGGRMNGLSDVVAFGNQGKTKWDVVYELADVRGYAKQARMYLNRDATLANFEKEKGDLMHCAVEIQCTDRRPANWFFVLADEGYERARYPRIGEFFACGNYPAVILSNLGPVPLSPSIPRIIRMNGTSDLITTAYMPLRKTKKYFGELFYTNLLAGNSPEAAYRNMILEMMRNPDFASPSYWASFFLW